MKRTAAKRIFAGVMICALMLMQAAPALADGDYTGNHYIMMTALAASGKPGYTETVDAEYSGVAFDDNCGYVTAFGALSGRPSQDLPSGYKFTVDNLWYATAFGALSTLSGSGTTAIGYNTLAGAEGATALGYNASAKGQGSVGIGRSVVAAGVNSVAMGIAAYAGAVNSVAIGSSANASYDNSVALGANSVTGGAGEVSVGDAASGLTRKITNVAAGVADTDAATVGQMNAAVSGTLQSVAVSSNGMLSQTTVAGSTTDVAQLQDTVVGGLEVNASDKTLTINRINKYTGENVDSKVVDVAALINAKVEIAGALGNISTSNGIVSTKKEYEVGGIKHVDVDFAIGDDFTLKDDTYGNYTNYRKTGVTVSNDTEDKQADLSYGQLKFTNGSDTATLSTDGLAINGKTYVSDSGLNANNQKITSVADGTISANSLDAVNGSQLYAEQQARIADVAAINASAPMTSGITAAKVDKYETYITSNGLNANGNKITNVAAGELSATSTDAVNGSQLYATNQSIANTQMQLAETNKELQEVGAMSAALAGLHYMEPSGEGDDKVTGAVAYGGYRSENAVAVGLAYKPNQNMMFSASTSIGSNQNAYNAGVAFKFGKGETKATRATLQKQVKYLNEKLGDANTKIEQQDATIKALLERLEAVEKKVK